MLGYDDDERAVSEQDWIILSVCPSIYLGNMFQSNGILRTWIQQLVTEWNLGWGSGLWITGPVSPRSGLPVDVVMVVDIHYSLHSLYSSVSTHGAIHFHWDYGQFRFPATCGCVGISGSGCTLIPTRGVRLHLIWCTLRRRGRRRGRRMFSSFWIGFVVEAVS